MPQSQFGQFVAATTLAITVLTGTGARAACSDSEYKVYQKYDVLLEANPQVSTTELRTRYAKQIGMAPQSLKELHMRCSARWANDNREEASEYARKGLEDMKRDCLSRPANDAACAAIRGK